MQNLRFLFALCHFSLSEGNYNCTWTTKTWQKTTYITQLIFKVYFYSNSQKGRNQEAQRVLASESLPTLLVLSCVVTLLIKL